MARGKSGYTSYDASFKISICEEYLRRKSANPNLKKSAFAKEKNIRNSTFYDWIREYENSKNSDDGIIPTESTNVVTVPKFVELTEDEDTTEESNTSSNTIVLKYKGAALEFSSNDLEKALEIMRRW